MTDEWGFYFCQMGGRPGSVVFDEGIADEVKNSPLSTALFIRTRLKNPNEDGLTSNSDFESLPVIENRIIAAVERGGGLFLGRVTNDGFWHFLGLVLPRHDAITSEIRKLAEETGYELRCVTENDPDKDIYWKQLWPTEDDRRVMGDLSVIERLCELGDDNTIHRPVEHWTYFHEHQDAVRFRNWLDVQIYKQARIEDAQELEEPPFDSERWCVRFVHHGAMRIADVTHHTLALSRKARELGGRYDGWETLIMTAE